MKALSWMLGPITGGEHLLPVIICSISYTLFSPVLSSLTYLPSHCRFLSCSLTCGWKFSLGCFPRQQHWPVQSRAQHSFTAAWVLLLSRCLLSSWALPLHVLCRMAQCSHWALQGQRGFAGDWGGFSCLPAGSCSLMGTHNRQYLDIEQVKFQETN